LIIIFLENFIKILQNFDKFSQIFGKKTKKSASRKFFFWNHDCRKFTPFWIVKKLKKKSFLWSINS